MKSKKKYQFDDEDVLEHVAAVFEGSVVGLWEGRLHVERLWISDWQIAGRTRVFDRGGSLIPFVSYRIDMRYQGHAENLEPRFKASIM
jgi:hypothetical protein